ncbi:MAG: hypothetical protein ACE3JP_08110 [Ectobacillus sp.]
MKKFVLSLIFGIFSLLSIHTSAFAYSYGDPNEEKIAEAYKEMVIQLDKNPPNYKEAKKIYQTVQEEIDMHMGPEPSEVMLSSLDKEEKEEIVKNMQRVLVLNINRRLVNIDKQFEEYDTSKRLLAKAFATYEALSPVIVAKDKELDAKMRDEFNKALEALGNPGLFGVGKKEANKEVFGQSKAFILDNLKKEFDIKDFKAGHFKESATEDTAAVEKTEWTDLKNIKNWLPLLVIAGVLVAVIVYAIKKRR